MTDVQIKLLPAPATDVKEILRYARWPEASADMKLLNSCLRELLPDLRYAVCWREMNVRVQDDGVDLEGLAIPSAALAGRLNGCGRALLFAATVGAAPDRLIRKYSRLSPVRALLFQAIGTERVEALCDAFTCDFPVIGQRFSPGYGDLPLSCQKQIFELLDCPRRLGLTLTESLLMLPAKSVTAIQGIREG